MRNKEAAALGEKKREIWNGSAELPDAKDQKEAHLGRGKWRRERESKSVRPIRIYVFATH